MVILVIFAIDHRAFYNRRKFGQNTSEFDGKGEDNACKISADLASHLLESVVVFFRFA
jgi:hypothetical protein